MSWSPKAFRLFFKEAMASPDPLAALHDTSVPSADCQTPLDMAARDGALVEWQLIKYLSRLVDDADWDRLDACVRDERLGRPQARACFDLVGRHRRCQDDVRFGEALAVFCDLPADHRLRNRMARFLVSLALRDGRVEWIRQFCEAMPGAEIAALSGHSLRRVITRLVGCGASDEAMDAIRKAAPHVRPITRLQLRAIERATRGVVGPEGTSEAVLRDLARLAMPDRPLWTWLIGAYRAQLATASLTLMDLRHCAAQRDALVRLLEGALRAGRPLSAVRIGDGESYLLPLPEVASVATLTRGIDARRMERLWWGRPVADDALRARLRARAVAAFRGADLVGLYSGHAILDELSATVPLTGAIGTRALLAHVHALGTAIPIAGKVAMEAHATQHLYDAACIARLSAAAVRVVLVGCHLPSASCLPEGTVHIPICPEAKLAEAEVVPGARSILHDYDAIAADVAAACGPGTLLLVAAGYGGKGLCQVGRDAGAVAVDIGSALDRLAGYESRGMGMTPVAAASAAGGLAPRSAAV